jgi:hypothetical protein
MRKTIALAMILSIVLAACAVAGGSESPVDPEPVAGTAPDGWSLGQAFVSTAQVSVLESFPIQVRLAVEGELPTPCHVAVWEVVDDGETINVVLESAADPDQVCAQVIEPFEVSIDLGSFAEGSRTVTLNGEPVGAFSA